MSDSVGTLYLLIFLLYSMYLAIDIIIINCYANVVTLYSNSLQKQRKALSSYSRTTLGHFVFTSNYDFRKREYSLIHFFMPKEV